MGEDVVEAGLVDAPDDVRGILQEVSAPRNVLLAYFEDDAGLELVQDLQVEAVDQFAHDLGPVSSSSEDVGVVDHQFVASAEAFLEGVDAADALELALADNADPLAEVLHLVHHVARHEDRSLPLALYVDYQVLMRMSQIWRRWKGSRPELGSSRKMTLGLPTRAMAMESLRCIPPESSFARRDRL
jgi:hypothetical protein